MSNIKIRTWELATEVMELRTENAALRNEIARLNNQTNWVCKCGGTDCAGQKENAALRAELEFWRDGSIVREEDHNERKELRKDKERLDWMEKNSERQPTGDFFIRGMDKTAAFIFRAAIDAARKEAQP